MLSRATVRGSARLFSTMSKLSIQDLQKTAIGNKWLTTNDRKSFEVKNPANGSVIGIVPDITAEDVKAAISAADNSSWKNLTPSERAQKLRKWNDLILEHCDTIAEILSSENGKTVAEAAGEVKYAASFVEWFAEECRRMYGDTHPAPVPNKRIFVSYQPVGVCALITPWNFPAAMITRKQAAALAAGCTTVTKPSELTPLTAIYITHLAEQAGIPLDAVSLLTSTNAKMVGDLLCESETVKKLSFTGSTGVGKQLTAQCAATMKKVSMELGGNAPVVVFDDADIDNAVAQVILAKFRGTGQTCVCANRIFVHENIFDEFAKKFAAKAAELKMGPITTEAQFKKVGELVADAKSKGAKVIFEGELPPGANPKGFHFPATILDMRHADGSCRVFAEEIFGPVAALQSFKTESEVLQRANASRSGLAGYIFTKDLSRSVRVSEKLQVGMVGVNTGAISHPEAPFGGVKESGLGREGSRQGWLEYTEVKYTCVQIDSNELQQ